MRRVIVFALLALALPTAALANSFTLPQRVKETFEFGIFQSGTFRGSITNGGSFQIEMVGNSKTPLFSYDIGSLTKVPTCTPTNTCFTFSTGTITVKNTAGATVLTDSLTNGSLALPLDPRFFVSFNAILPPTSMFTGGFTNFNFGFKGDELFGGAGFAEITPEPSTLEGILLGTGMLASAEMTRRWAGGFARHRPTCERGTEGRVPRGEPNLGDVMDLDEE